MNGFVTKSKEFFADFFMGQVKILINMERENMVKDYFIFDIDINIHIILNKFWQDIMKRRGVIFQVLLWSVKNWISLKSRQNFWRKFYWISNLHS